MAVAPDQIPTFLDESELRVVIGLCSYLLTEESKEKFLGTEWTVTPDADRTGYRYRGDVLGFVEREPPPGAGSGPGNVVDINYPMGSIQVPGGEPIVLARDAVTGGGFATIGTVITADLDLLAQTKTNDKTRFRSVTLDEALQARKQRRQRLEEIKSTIEG
jgi:allophanate hydrolase subunit 2